MLNPRLAGCDPFGIEEAAFLPELKVCLIDRVECLIDGEERLIEREES